MRCAFGFNFQIAMLSAAAKETQSQYGTNNHPATLDTGQAATMNAEMNNQSSEMILAAQSGRCQLKKNGRPQEIQGQLDCKQPDRPRTHAPWLQLPHQPSGPT